MPTRPSNILTFSRSERVKSLRLAVAIFAGTAEILKAPLATASHNHRRNVGGGGDARAPAPLQYYFYLRIVFFCC